MYSGPPEILTQRSEHLIVRGRPFVMTCEATGAPRLRVYWKKDNNTLYNNSLVTVGQKHVIAAAAGVFDSNNIVF